MVFIAAVGVTMRAKERYKISKRLRITSRFVHELILSGRK